MAAAVWAALVVLLAGSPDLAETRVSVSQHGASLHVTDVVLNLGTATAARSTSGYYLAHARIGGRAVGTLLPRASSRGSRTLTIPGSVRAGSYRLLACADDRNRIPESNERNNCRAAAQVVEVADRAPPSFAGLQSATTCIPGPIDGERFTPYYLRWAAAADNVTRAGAIVYDVYQAAEAGGEDFSNATYTTTPGATSFTTPRLSSAYAHYFVVHARDKAGNRDSNRIERLGENLCL